MQSLVNILVQLDRIPVTAEEVILKYSSCIYMNTNL